jgi:hypothetical protein
MPPHSSHLLQPLDVRCFSPLKKAYSGEINQSSKARITHIDKTEFFLAFHATHNKVFKPVTIKGGFKGAGLIPFDREAVLSKLNVKIRTPTSRPGSPALPAPWVSQTPHNSTQAVSQSTLIKDRISRHEGSSPTPILAAVDRLEKGTQSLAHAVTLLTQETNSLREANAALSKRRRARKTYVQDGGALSTQEAKEIINEKEKGKRPASEMAGSAEEAVCGRPTKRRCGNCGETGYNARTCEKDVESSADSDSNRIQLIFFVVVL